MEISKKRDTGCLLKGNYDKVFLEEVKIQKEKTTYFYRIDQREKEYFLLTLLEKYRFSQEMICDRDVKRNETPFLFYLLWRDVSIEKLKCYLQNKPIEWLEKLAWRDTFFSDTFILYDAHIPIDLKKSLIYDYLSLCLKYTDVFHRMLLDRMIKDMGVSFEDIKVYRK